MNTISTRLTLVDNMSRSLNNIQSAVNRLNGSARNTGNAFSSINNIGEGGVLGRLGGIATKLASIAATALSIRKFVEVSDTLASTGARLAGIVDATSTVAELQEKVFDAAQRSRSEYASMASFVARVGNMGGKLFSGNDELVKFAETLNKQMVINGTSTQEASAAMVQLSQALGSGVLRGDELNSVFEQAPGIIQLIADYMGVEIGQIRNMASEGQLTAEIVKNAVLSGADEIDERFNDMPYTWSQVWQSFKNQAVMAMQPLADMFGKLINSDEFVSAMNSIANALSVVIQLTAQAIKAMTEFGGTKYIVEGLVAALGTGGLLWVLTQIPVAIAAIRSGLMTLVAIIAGMNLEIVAIAAVVAAVFVAISYYLDKTGTTVRELIEDIAGRFRGFGEGLTAVTNNVCEAIRVAFHNAFEHVKEYMSSVFSFYTSGITSIINLAGNTKIGKELGLDTVSSFVSDKLGSYTGTYETGKYENIGDAYDRGYKKGSMSATKTLNSLNQAYLTTKGKVYEKFGLGSSGSTSTFDASAIPSYSDLGTTGGADGSGGGSDGNTAEIETAENTADIAKTIGDAAKDLALIKRAALNKEMNKIDQSFQIKIDAPISGADGFDLDGFAGKLAGAVQVELSNKMRSSGAGFALGSV